MSNINHQGDPLLIDDCVDDGLYLGDPWEAQDREISSLGFCLHDLANYAKKNNLSPITDEVIAKAKKDGAI